MRWTREAAREYTTIFNFYSTSNRKIRIYYNKNLTGVGMSEVGQQGSTSNKESATTTTRT